MRRAATVAGILVLAAAWLGPLPALSRHAFVAHMSLHVSVIAIAAPLLAFGIAGSRLDAVRQAPRWFSPIPASVFELVVVWAWHAPALHALARSSTVMLVIEQAIFFGAGLLVWMAAFGGTPRQQRERAVAGISGLLLASMHMTLLGVLLALAERPLYVHAHAPFAELTPLQDQQAGGVIMLLVGGAAYLAGALYRVSGLLKGHGHAVSAR